MDLVVCIIMEILHLRKFMFMCKYYPTLEFSGSNNEIIKFDSGIIIDTQTGKRLLSLFGADVAGEWNCNDEWVYDDQILFSPSAIIMLVQNSVLPDIFS